MKSFTTTAAVLKLWSELKYKMSHKFRIGGYNRIWLWKPSGGLHHGMLLTCASLEIENKKIYALYGSKKILNDHDQDNLFVISEVTNLGSYSSSHRGMWQAAPWEAVFYKQTDQDLYRKRWSETAGLYTCTGQERLKKKQLCLVRGTTATTVLAGWWGHQCIRWATLFASFQNLKPTGFFEMTDAQTTKITTQTWLFPRHPLLRKSILKLAFNIKCSNSNKVYKIYLFKDQVLVSCL